MCTQAGPAFDAVLESPTDMLRAREAEVLGALFVLPPSNLAAAVQATALGLADRGVLPAEVAAAFVSDPGRVGAVVAVLRTRSGRRRALVRPHSVTIPGPRRSTARESGPPPMTHHPVDHQIINHCTSY